MTKEYTEEELKLVIRAIKGTLTAIIHSRTIGKVSIDKMIDGSGNNDKHHEWVKDMLSKCLFFAKKAH